MARAKILIVEDESIIAEYLQEVLVDMGYEVPAMAVSGSQAIEKAEEVMPDLILMDIRLKGEMDGIEAAKWIHARLNVPVIFMTGCPDDEVLERAKTINPYGYMIKPFNKKTLKTNVEMAFHRVKIERQLYENRGNFFAVLENIKNAVIAADMDGKVKVINNSAKTLTGWNEQEAVGKSLEAVFNIKSEEDRLNAKNLIEKSIQAGNSIDQLNHTVLTSKCGKKTSISYNMIPIKDENNNITNVVLVFQDTAG